MRKVLIAVLCCLLLTGCGRVENPYQVDTVVRIPVDPTDVPEQDCTEPAETVLPTETEAPAEATDPTEVAEETQPPEPTEGKSGTSAQKPTSTGKPTSTKKPSSGGSKEPAKATEPELTEPPTEIPETEPPTEAVATEVYTEAPTEPPYDPSGYSVGSLEKAILKEINSYRAEAGLGELSISKRLCGIAALRAEEARELWSHSRPDGRSYTTAMSDYGYGFGTSAEYLAHASGSGDGGAIVAKWMDTDSSKNILNEDYSTAGIGVYRSGGVTVVACLLVG